MSLRIQLLGPARLSRDGQSIDLPGYRPLALLAYLLVTGRAHSRDHLVDLLFDAPDDPRAALRWTLSKLRQAVGSEQILANRREVAFNFECDYWLDVAAFKAGELELYQGDFLEGLYVRDAFRFEEWLLLERERLRGRYQTGLEQRLSEQEGRGNASGVVATGHRLLQLDNLREDCYVALMGAYARLGQREAALAQYHKCRQVLAAELGVEPDPATKALYEQIWSNEAAQQPPPPRAGPEPADAPPLPRSAAPWHNLPTQPTLFIGRETELAEITALLADPACRLLTLVGPGGIGKTRLAIEAARRSGLAHGARFVSLAPLSSAEPLVPAVAEAVGLTLYGSTDPKEQLFSYLRDQELLLVLDNFEHLLLPPSPNEAAADPPGGDGTGLVADLLAHAPRLKFLVTSRERLNLQSEWIFNVEGLTVPTNDNTDALESFSAPRLFLQRARRLKRQFGQQPEERRCIGHICRLVGGIPLALELAAAWTNALSCPEIVREIERNLDFLAATVRDLPERHRNMRAVFDYSWQMLTAQERQLFRRLSVCRGGFTRAAAEAIAGNIPWTEEDLQVDEAGEVQLSQRQPGVLAALSGLVDKSFLRHTAEGRYEVHELMRQFGAAKLGTDSENEARTRDMHAAYYLNLVAHQEPLMKGRGQRQAHQRVAREYENIKLGWLHAAEHGQTELLTRAFGAFWLSCIERNVFFELAAVCAQAHQGLEKWLTPAGRTQPAVELALGAMALGESGASFRIGDLTFTSKVEQAISLFRSLKADSWTALALNFYGAARQILGDYEAAWQCFAESAELSRKVGDRWLTGYSLNDLGLVTHLLGDTAAAQELSQQSLDILTELGDRRGKAFAFNNLGFYAFHQGDYAEADWLYRECIKLRRVNGDQWGVATGIIHLGAVARARGETHQANQHLLKAIRTAMTVRAFPVVLEALVELALLLADEGLKDQAEEMLQVCLHHPGLTKPAQAKAEQQLAALRGLAKPLPLARLPEDEAARELDRLLARLLNE